MQEGLSQEVSEWLVLIKFKGLLRTTRKMETAALVY